MFSNQYNSYIGIYGYITIYRTKIILVSNWEASRWDASKWEASIWDETILNSNYFIKFD